MIRYPEQSVVWTVSFRYRLEYEPLTTSVTGVSRILACDFTYWCNDQALC